MNKWFDEAYLAGWRARAASEGYTEDEINDFIQQKQTENSSDFSDVESGVSSQAYDKDSKLESFLRGGLNAGTLGLSSAVEGAWRARDPNVSFTEGRQGVIRDVEKARQDNPKTFAAGEVAGIALPAVATAGLAPGVVGGANLASRIGAGVFAGGVLGAANAAGRSGTVEEFQENLPDDAALGALVGTIAPVVGHYGGILARRFLPGGLPTSLGRRIYPGPVRENIAVELPSGVARRAAIQEANAPGTVTYADMSRELGLVSRGAALESPQAAAQILDDIGTRKTEIKNGLQALGSQLDDNDFDVLTPGIKKAFQSVGMEPADPLLVTHGELREVRRRLRESAMFFERQKSQANALSEKMTAAPRQREAYQLIDEVNAALHRDPFVRDIDTQYEVLSRTLSNLERNRMQMQAGLSRNVINRNLGLSTQTPGGSVATAAPGPIDILNDAFMGRNAVRRNTNRIMHTPVSPDEVASMEALGARLRDRGSNSSLWQRLYPAYASGYALQENQ